MRELELKIYDKSIVGGEHKDLRHAIAAADGGEITRVTAYGQAAAIVPVAIAEQALRTIAYRTRDGQPLTRLGAARCLNTVGGLPVWIVELDHHGRVEDEVTVHARREGFGGVILPPEIGYSSVSMTAAKARRRIALITLGTELAELADGLWAELADEQ